MGVPIRRSPGRLWLGCIAAAASVLYAWYIAWGSFEIDGRRGFSLFDDAMISMRYARHLAQGGGLRWNVGAPPVEGYTNFLWTVWMALLQLLPIPARTVSLAISLSSATLLVANLWLVRSLVLGARGRSVSALVAVAGCALAYPLVFWSLRGLEVGLLAFLLDAAVLLAWRCEVPEEGRPRPWLLALVLATMVLVRDDAIVAASCVLAFVATSSAPGRTAVVPVGAVTAALLGHLAFRIGYYGAPLPNTYYLKLENIPVGARLVRGAIATLRTAAAETMLVLVLGAFAVLARPQDRRVRLLAAIALSQLGVATLVGGDAWESWGQPDRFVAVALPILFVGAALGAEQLWDARTGRHHLYGYAFALALFWRAVALGAADFVPRSFTVTPPIDLHSGLRGWSDPTRCLVSVLAALLAIQLVMRSARRVGRPAPRLALGIGLVVVLATVGFNWKDFLGGEVTARQIRWDADNAIFGLRLGELAPPETTIAVVAAGGIPFFSDLPAVDLLGKSDPHIAHEQPLERFIPGHDKRDYAYSLRTYAPDVVLELWHHAPEELREIAALHYRQLSNGMYVREGCPDALVELLLHGLPPYPFAAHRPTIRELPIGH